MTDGVSCNENIQQQLLNIHRKYWIFTGGAMHVYRYINTDGRSYTFITLCLSNCV